jgi:hypothetical protein
MLRQLIKRCGIGFNQIEKYQSTVKVEYILTMKIKGDYHKIIYDSHKEFFEDINVLERNRVTRFGEFPANLKNSYLDREVD